MESPSWGLSVIELGGGRRVSTDKIDYSVGFDRVVQLGGRIEKGDLLMRIHAGDEVSADQIERRVRRAISIGETPAKAKELIRAHIV